MGGGAHNSSDKGGGSVLSSGRAFQTETVVKDLTLDHKPELTAERQYIESMGGRVLYDGFANHRVYMANGNYPGRNMSRALGDVLGSTQAGINNAPDVSVWCLKTGELLTPERRRMLDEAGNEKNFEATPTLPLLFPQWKDESTRSQLIICSDGVWEFLSSDRTKQMMLQFPRERARDAAETLAKKAWDCWIAEEHGLVVDDITALVLYL